MTTAGEALEQFAKASAKGGKVSPGMVYLGYGIPSVVVAGQ